MQILAHSRKTGVTYFQKAMPKALKKKYQVMSIKSQMGSRPRYPLQYHALVCIKKCIFIVGIGQIHDKELTFIFDMFLFFVRSNEERYKYYKISIIYTYVFNFCYNVIYLQCLLCFGLDAEIFSVLLLQVLFCLQNHEALVTTIQKNCLYYLPSTKQPDQ